MQTLLRTLLALSLFAAASSARAGETVVTTLPSLADIAARVGGERIEVEALCRGYEDPHYLQPKPSYARKLRNATLFIYGGLELEVGWLPPLIETARNPRIRPGAAGLLEASEAITNILEIPDEELSRAEGDIHPEGNPHYMLDPRNALAVADLLALRLGELDPDGKQGYLDGAGTYRQELEGRIADWEARAEALRGRPVLAYHKQWEYFADWLGLEIVDYIEAKAGIPPSPRHVASVIELIRAREIEVVLAATFTDTDAARKVAERGGARLVVLPAEVGGVDDTGSYIELMERLVTSVLGPAGR